MRADIFIFSEGERASKNTFKSQVHGFNPQTTMLWYLLLKELKLAASPWSLIPEERIIKSLRYMLFCAIKCTSSRHYFACLHMFKGYSLSNLDSRGSDPHSHCLEIHGPVCWLERARTRTRVAKCNMWVVHDVNLHVISVAFVRYSLSHKDFQLTNAVNIFSLIQSQTQKERDNKTERTNQPIKGYRALIPLINLFGCYYKIS